MAGDSIDLAAKDKFSLQLAGADFSPWWSVCGSTLENDSGCAVEVLLLGKKKIN